MTASIPAGPPPRLSVPPKFVAPRQLTDAELGTLRAIADVLIPAAGDNPAATSEPAFDQWLARAADARADAFDDITAVLAQLDRAAPDTIDQTWMRDHNARRLELLDAAATFAWEQAGRQGRDEELAPAFQRAAGHLAVLRRMTSDFREPVIWLVLAIVASGIAQIVAFVLLDQDLVKHDQAEVGAEHELSAIYGQLGQQLASPDPNRVKRPDNYVGRIVAAIFSLGIYMFWWYYNQMEEPNRHFAGNWAQEDELVKAVDALS